MRTEVICGIECKVFELGDSELLKKEERTIFWMRVKSNPAYTSWHGTWKYCNCAINPDDQNLEIWLDTGIYNYAIPVDPDLVSRMDKYIYPSITLEMNPEKSFADNLFRARWGVRVVSESEVTAMIAHTIGEV
jgi:hypothetical protein